MEKVYVTPSEAIKELNKGNTVYGDTQEGYWKARKKTKGIYEIVVASDEKEQTYNGTIKNVLKSFNSGPFKEGLYIKD